MCNMYGILPERLLEPENKDPHGLLGSGVGFPLNIPIAISIGWKNNGTIQLLNIMFHICKLI